MTDDEIKTIAHRMAWRYKHSSDPAHGDTYTFNDTCLIDFVRKVQAATIEACAAVCDEKGNVSEPDDFALDAVYDCAAAIRSMLPNQTSGTSTETKP